jgi:hypothetical protein
MFLVNNAASTGANKTFSPYALLAYTAIVPLPGLTAEWINGSVGSTGLYLSARLLRTRLRAVFVNKEAFPVEVALVLVGTSPSDNALNTYASQEAYLSRSGAVVKWFSLSPTTGMDRSPKIMASASNKSLFGVKNQRGLADSFTNSWNSTTDVTVVATSGMSYIVLVRTLANMVAGVQATIEADLTIELFELNPTKLL